MRGERTRRRCWGLFLLYVLVLGYLMFFSEKYGRISTGERAYKYNLIPFDTIRRFWVYRHELGVTTCYTNLFGNVAAFMPFGFLLPVICPGVNRAVYAALAGFGVSFLAETVQLLARVGCFDVDDLILNTLGAFAGYMIFVLLDYLRRCHGQTV